MESCVSPFAREDPPRPSRRALVCGTPRAALNIFAPDTMPPEAPPSSRRCLRPPSASGETREFAFGRLRRVRPPVHEETAKGIRCLPSAAARAQRVQVVGLTAAYCDPRNFPPSRAGLRCVRQTARDAVADVLAYPSPPSPPSPGPTRRGGGCSAQERFAQAVRDHAQHRRGGVTPFYVQLARGRVGQYAAHAPPPKPREWRLENGPETHTLRLDACAAQLISLTGMHVSLTDLAEILWGAKSLKEEMGDPFDETRLAEWIVSYRDFSTAFGENSDSAKLATIKI